MLRKFLIFAATSTLTVGYVAQGFSVSMDSTTTVLHVSDIHLDPYYGSNGATGGSACKQSSAPWNGTSNCDSPVSLAQAAINQLEHEIATYNVSVLLYTGDWVRHGTEALPSPTADMITIFAQVAAMLQQLVDSIAIRTGKAAPQVIAHPNPTSSLAIGNEDFYPDYDANDQSIPTSNVKAYGQALLAHNLLNVNQSAQYSKCAFYESLHPSGTLSTLALNTILYSSKAKATTADPCGQLAWLEGRLANAQQAGRNVYITAHIPPMMDLWESTFITAFNAVIVKYSSVVTAQFYGHTHMTAFLAPSNIAAYPPVFVGGSITRVSDTNTCYQRYTVNSQWKVTKWEQLMMSAFQTGLTPSNALWNISMNVGAALSMGPGPITWTSLQAGANAIKTSPAAFNSASNLLGGGYPSSIVNKVCTGGLMTGLCMKGLYCVFTGQTISELLTCGVTLGVSDEVVRSLITKMAKLSAHH